MTWQTCNRGEVLCAPGTALPALALCVCVHVYMFMCVYMCVCIYTHIYTHKMLCPSYVEDPALEFCGVNKCLVLFSKVKKGQRD